MNGLMGGVTRVTGSKIIWTVLGSTPGRTGEGMRVGTSKTKSTVKGATPGRMAVNTTECGKMANSTDRANTKPTLLKVLAKAFGSMGNVKSGYDPLLK